jgi:hypothetical protein
MTIRSRHAVLATIAAAITMLASACAGSVQVRPDEVIDLGPTRGDRYAAALRQTLDVYEAEVMNAYSQTYPSFEEAYTVARRFSDPELTAILQARLDMQGLTLEGLNQYAAEHPEWIAEQNRLYRERMEATRGTAFAIMARYERGEGRDALDPGTVEPPPAVTTHIAGR